MKWNEKVNRHCKKPIRYLPPPFQEPHRVSAPEEEAFYSVDSPDHISGNGRNHACSVKAVNYYIILWKCPVHLSHKHFFSNGETMLHYADRVLDIAKALSDHRWETYFSVSITSVKTCQIYILAVCMVRAQNWWKWMVCQIQSPYDRPMSACSFHLQVAYSNQAEKSHKTKAV